MSTLFRQDLNFNIQNQFIYHLITPMCEGNGPWINNSAINDKIASFCIHIQIKDHQICTVSGKR